MPFGEEKVTQFLGFPPTSVTYLKVSPQSRKFEFNVFSIIHTLYNVCIVQGGAQYCGGVQYHGGYHEYLGGVQYSEGIHDKCGG